MGCGGDGLIRQGPGRKSFGHGGLSEPQFCGIQEIKCDFDGDGPGALRAWRQSGARKPTLSESGQLCLNQDLRDSDGLGDGWRLVGET